MLQVNKISVDLGNNQVIDNLSFSIDSGILAILGLNGIGKTTLLRSIAGLLKIKKGTIQINNTNISNLTRNEIAKLISFVPQEYSSIFDYTVEEMILFGRTPYIKTFDLPGSNDYKIVNTIMREMNIESLKYRMFNELSGGEKRLVLISMTLAQNSEIVLFDEPTSFLDIKNSILIINKIKELVTEFKKTIIISMHDINESILFADKVLMLCSSYNYKFGKVNEMINKENLFELYKTNFDINMRADGKMFVTPVMKGK
jgi:iron complex transport system ATP-binding protein